MSTDREIDSGCCGLHAVCERGQRGAGAAPAPEYYDDEELDAYRGRAAEGYTEAEVEEFRYVLETMRTDEVRGWLRSLEERGVALPQELRDEAMLLME